MPVIIWQGRGYLVPLIVLLLLALTEAAMRALFQDPGYSEGHGWAVLVGLSLSAAVIWQLAIRLDARPGRVVTDEATGQQMELKPRHALFFIPLRRWPSILVAIGVIAFFVA